MKRDAVLSDCGRFRYILSRDWNGMLPRLCYVMLNPSTADASQDDPTIRKCIGFAERLGFGGFTVVNLYAYRATHPRDLRTAGYPVGPENNDFISIALDGTDAVVCAWGANARGLARPTEVLSLLRRRLLKPKALSLTAGGIPAHPLMLPYSCTLQPFGAPA